MTIDRALARLTDERMDRLAGRGFDNCRADGNGAIRVGCSQCESLVINGVACHETGCPNIVRDCRECGNPDPNGDCCAPDAGWDDADGMIEHRDDTDA